MCLRQKSFNTKEVKDIKARRVNIVGKSLNPTCIHATADVDLEKVKIQLRKMIVGRERLQANISPLER